MASISDLFRTLSGDIQHAMSFPSNWVIFIVDLILLVLVLGIPVPFHRIRVFPLRAWYDYVARSPPRSDMDRVWDLFRRLPRDIQDAVSLPSGAWPDDLALPPPTSNMERIWVLFRGLFRQITASSSRPAPLEDITPPQMIKMNDCVYEVYKPLEGKRASIELVFFHGLQLKETSKAHVTSWLCRNESKLWLNWIAEAIPDCRIITISYDSHWRRTNERGRTDMYVTTENLLQCLVEDGAKVGQDGCPVVFVGHCLGGLVMKELCVKAHCALGHSSEKFKKLLDNIRGLFFYASPNHGTELADMSTSSSSGAMFEIMTSLNTRTQRDYEQFRKLRQEYRWQTFAIGEQLEVTLGSFTGLVVTEASARSDVDGFYTDSTDHFNVSRPVSTTSASFRLFMSFLGGILKEDKARFGPKISLSEEVVGLEKQASDVQRMLGTARRLVIFGMGGIGKTTLAKTVYNSISGKFEYTCFLRDVKTTLSKRVDVDVLRNKIIESLLYKGKKVDEKNFSWSTLKRTKVLLVLDDVASESQVMVMTKEDGFLDESRVIVTSRDKSFLISGEFKLHNAKLLGEENSKQLFSINAFKNAHVTSGYEDLVNKFVEKCGGLPLALKVAGRYVRNPEKKVWNDALVRLGNAKALDGLNDDGLWSILRLSYDALQDEEKEMFLDIATLYYGRSLDEVKDVWKACSLTQDDCGWENLVDQGLVTEEYDPRFSGSVIRMHEVLRDLGRSIACPDPQNNTTHTRVLHEIRSPTTSWPFRQGAKPKVKVLQIIAGAKEGADPSCISVRDIHDLDDLRVLLIEGAPWDYARGSGRGRLSGACHLFPRNLLCLKIKNLDSWSDSDNEESFPKELEQQQTLRYLAIEECYKLETLPSSLGQLRGLQRLTIKYCRQLETLPSSLGCIQGLQYLKIYKCERLRALPDTLGKLRALKGLHLQRCSDLSLPETLGQLKVLEVLRIEGVSLPNSLGELQALKHLVIRRCSRFHVLEDTLGHLKALEHLEIEEPGSWHSPLNTLGQLQALKHLDLQSGGFGDSFPDSLCKIRGLEYLRILENESPSAHFLRAIPNSLGELKALKYLAFDGCRDLKALPGSIAQLQALEDLDIIKCGSLEDLPHTLGQLKSLKRLQICCKYGVGRLKAIPDTIGELQSLEDLRVEASGLVALPSTLGQLQALMRLTLSGCTDLKSLPDIIGGLQALKHLVVFDCGLETLPGTLGGLQALEKLELHGCHFLKALPDTLGLLDALKNLYISHCTIEALPLTLGHLQSLENLRISKCYSLRALPDTLGHLQSLEELLIYDCSSLRALPDTLGQLETLKTLTVRYCESLQDLPGSLKHILGRLEGVEVDNVRYMQVSS